MNLDNVLYEATMEVFEGLGEEVMQSLVWQMGLKGISFVPETFDIKLFAITLREFFGDGAESLLEEIYQNAICRLEFISPSISLHGENGSSHDSPALSKLLTLFGDSNDNSKGVDQSS